MGYYKNLIIANQVEEADRFRSAKRRTTYRRPEIVTDKRTMIILLGSSMFFSITTILLAIWVAWLV
jgi:hypothetical protein